MRVRQLAFIPGAQTVSVLIQREHAHLLRSSLYSPQAAAYINENEITLSDYVILLDDTEQHMIDILREEFEDEGRYGDIKIPIATTWLISCEQIRTHDPVDGRIFGILVVRWREGYLQTQF
jgi:hypothetical protein